VRKFLILILCSALYTTAAGQSVYYPVGMPFYFSANAGEKFTNALNAAANPSLVPGINNIQAAVYAEKKYLTDINLLILTVCAPFSGNGVSLMFQRFGNSLFNENVIGLGYGKRIGSFSAGVLFQHIKVNVAGEKRASFIRAGVTSTYEIDENVFFGFTVINPQLLAKVKSAKLHAASSFSLMLGWEATADVYAGFEFRKDEAQPLSLIFTLQYRLKENLVCSLNWNTWNHQPFASLSWVQQQVTVEVGCNYHNTLGASPTVGIVYKKPAGK
jgi:hypothetical protein